MSHDLHIDEPESGTAVVHPEGPVDIHTAHELHEALSQLASRKDLEVVVLDASEITRLDSAAIATVSIADEAFEEAGIAFRIEGLSDEHRETFEIMPARTEVEEGEPRLGFFAQVGEAGYDIAEHARGLTLLFIDTLIVSWRAVFRRRPPPPGSYTEQSVAIGVDAFPIIALLSLLLGLILAFQAAYQLAQFGANIYVANLVGISMVREFGPMMTGIMLAGRSGSSIAAELGTMVVQEEVDALRVMGIDPKRYLVLPKMLAILTMQPALTLFSNMIGIFGGFIIATLYLDLGAPVYIDQTLESIEAGDWFHGLLKSFVFAMIIGFVGCYSGLNIKGGASGVGRATTRAVVSSIFMIIVADSIFATVSTLTAP
jgi:phospholipid/cholesterol/gamma-HCH transport system permease protein